MHINEFFPYQVCINLNRRPDRWQRIQERFIVHGIDRVMRFPALDGRQVEIPSVWNTFPGAYGCLRSHLAVVEQARESGQPSVLIFEDDAVLAARSEEHTSELQSQSNLVCRLLLEKKKKHLKH